MPMNPFWAGNPASIGQQTLAGQIITANASRGGSAGPRRKRRASKKSAPRTRKASRAKRAGKRARLVKGSAAAKAYMAKIRRKRRR
jgi:hypothetical protein